MDSNPSSVSHSMRRKMIQPRNLASILVPSREGYDSPIEASIARYIGRDMWSAPKKLYRSWCQHDVLAINQRQNNTIHDILRSNPLRRNSLFLRRNRATDHTGSKYPYWFKVIKYSYVASSTTLPISGTTENNY